MISLEVYDEAMGGYPEKSRDKWSRNLHRLYSADYLLGMPQLGEDERNGFRANQFLWAF